mgnify:CR=1 FL=1
MNLKFKKLSKNSVTPSYAKDGDAGLDLTATEIVKNSLFEVWYNTDIAIEIPKNHFGMLVPRSSISNDSALYMSNSIGIIDAGYRGGMQIRFNRSIKGFFSRKQYKKGERIAQLIIVPFKSVTLEKSNFLSNSQRGMGSYGSTTVTNKPAI